MTLLAIIVIVNTILLAILIKLHNDRREWEITEMQRDYLEEVFKL